MTTVYFIRHAESDTSVRDGQIRPLTEKGMRDRVLVTKYLEDKNIEGVISSPFKRAVDTVAHFAEKYGFEIQTEEDFKERRSDWPREGDLLAFIKRQWQDMDYTLSNGETLNEVQKRNIAALEDALLRYKNKNIAIGTHGMSLSTIINYYDKSFGYDDFADMVKRMPWIVKLVFDGLICVSIEKIDVFNINREDGGF